MSGNEGGYRNNRDLNNRSDEDVNTGPASDVLLQETQTEAVEVLIVSSVEGDPGHSKEPIVPQAQSLATRSSLHRGADLRVTN